MKKIEKYRLKFYEIQNKMYEAKEKFTSEVVFSDEFLSEPSFCINGDGELIAVLDDGRECSSSDIVECMLEKGCVEPSDFS